MVAGDACDGETPAAWMTPVTSPSAVADATSAWTDARDGDVDGRGADLEAGVAQDVGRGGGVLLAQVGQQDVLAGAHPPRDRLADRPGPDDDDDVAHGRSNVLMARSA